MPSPTYYKLTFTQLKAQVEHALGGVPDSRISSADIVNAALAYLVGLHEWTWRKGFTTLSLVAGQGYVNLPEDFETLIALQPATTLFNTIKLAHPEDVMRARVVGFAGVRSYWGYIGLGAQAAATDVPRRQLILGPIPSASEADTFILTYRKILPILSGATDVPAIPYGMFELLRCLVRAFAVSTEEQQAGHDWEMFNQQIPNVIAADSLSAGRNLGRGQNQLQDFEVNAEIPLNAAIRTPYDP